MTNEVKFLPSVKLDDGHSIWLIASLDQDRLTVSVAKDGVGNGSLVLNKEKALELAVKLKEWAEA